MTNMENGGIAGPEEAFWSYSLQVYETPGVMAACLDLQDRRGCDVNLLLLCGWRASTERQTLREADFAAIVAAIRPWTERAVIPLRGIRRALKHGIPEMPASCRESFRKRVADLELEAERLAQGLMVATLGDLPFETRDSAREALERSLATYWEVLGLQPDIADVEALNCLTAACLSDRPAN